MLSTYMLNSNQLLVYQLNTLYKMPTFWSLQKNTLAIFFYEFTNLLFIFFFLNCKVIKKLNTIFIIVEKPLEI